MSDPIVIAIDGPSASGKSTNAKIIAAALGYAYVDTGAMYRTLAWHALQKQIDVYDAEAVAALCRDWPAELANREGSIWLAVDGVFPEAEIRTKETSAAVSHVAAVPFVRDWMKERQRSCVQFGNLVMEGRDIGSNIFPETLHKFYMDAAAAVRQARRDADGVQDNLAARDQRDSTRAASPLMIADGATVINNAGETPEETSARIMAIVEDRLRND
ncbi:MAG: (d)CMP kinase [Verrucomicrobia subdivision 3 bacterium]|nr:(d)CMP kinase [Limisphaerales bacterium]